jgi:hypothetical protein
LEALGNGCDYLRYARAGAGSGSHVEGGCPRRRGVLRVLLLGCWAVDVAGMGTLVSTATKLGKPLHSHGLTSVVGVWGAYLRSATASSQQPPLRSVQMPGTRRASMERKERVGLGTSRGSARRKVRNVNSSARSTRVITPRLGLDTGTRARIKKCDD